MARRRGTAQAIQVGDAGEVAGAHGESPALQAGIAELHRRAELDDPVGGPREDPAGGSLAQSLAGDRGG
eukprot:7765177-Lingulodinium_polyedra.AAC.1